jgi:hypothetical protein
MAIRTMDRATDAITRMTGWCATVVMGGPDPKKGGGIHVVWYVNVDMLLELSLTVNDLQLQ